MKILHSLIFQALKKRRDLRRWLIDSNSAPLPGPNDDLQQWLQELDTDKLSKDEDFVKSLLCTILENAGPTYIVLDGLDDSRNTPGGDCSLP